MFKRTVPGMTVAAVLATALLAGCVVVPAPLGPPGPADAYVGATVAVAPPPAPVEYVGVAPAPGFVWAAGYWNWVGGQHVWVAGRWVHGRPGFYWVPHRWVHVAGGWRLAPGHWQRR
jgi:hypothetical protein